MVKLEDITKGTRLKGLSGQTLLTIESTTWHGSDVIEVIYKDPQGQLGNHLVYRDDEASLALVEAGRPWSFDGDAEQLKLVSEAYRHQSSVVIRPICCDYNKPNHASASSDFSSL